MVIDSHTHAWEHWPYSPAVPDPESRGRVEQLLHEMDRHGVDRAVVICARIDHNPDNNDYVAECVRRHPERLVQFADVDCSWTDTYHQAGAADRLEAAAKQYHLHGYTHYVRSDVEWFASDEGQAFFAKTADLNLVASLALSTAWQPALRALAQRFPSVTFLCHHMAGARVDDPGTVDELVASAAVPNIWIKLSGFHYVARTSWEYPYPEVQQVLRRLLGAYGPERFCWGSDYPVVRAHMTYQHALEAFRTHCDFVADADQALILGANLERLLEGAGQ